MHAVRYMFAAIAALFLVGVLYQVFLAGMALFAGGSWQNHVDTGYLVAAIPILLIGLAFFARAGRTTMWLTVATLVVATVQTFLPLAADAVPWVAALHPVNALLVFGLAVLVAWRAVALARSPGHMTMPAADQASQEA